MVKLDGSPWFVATDTLLAMGYPQSSHTNIKKKLSTEETIVKRVHKGVRSMSLISESGLYKLIMRSDNPEAPRISGLGHQSGPPRPTQLPHNEKTSQSYTRAAGAPWARRYFTPLLI